MGGLNFSPAHNLAMKRTPLTKRCYAGGCVSSLPRPTWEKFKNVPFLLVRLYRFAFYSGRLVFASLILAVICMWVMDSHFCPWASLLSWVCLHFLCLLWFYLGARTALCCRGERIGNWLCLLVCCR